MENSLYIAAHHVRGLQKQLTITSENVANINTSGFKRLLADYTTVQPDATVDSKFSTLNPEYIDSKAGGMTKTDNPLDVAIGGDGYFAIQKDGRTVYTRNGQFVQDQLGNLVTMQGHQVLSAGLGPLNIPEDAQKITIAGDGTLTAADGRQLGRIGVFEFTADQQRQFVRSGDNTYAAPGVGVASTNATVMQGTLEGSNVNNVTEVVNLTDVTRRYSSSLRMIQNLEELEQRAIRTLPSLN